MFSYDIIPYIYDRMIEKQIKHTYYFNVLKAIKPVVIPNYYN